MSSKIINSFRQLLNCYPRPLISKNLILTCQLITLFEINFLQKNTFQITLATDGSDSYVIINYEKLEWIQSGGKSPGQPDALAQAGFLSGDGTMKLLRDSGTDQVRNLPMLVI